MLFVAKYRPLSRAQGARGLEAEHRDYRSYVLMDDRCSSVKPTSLP